MNAANLIWRAAGRPDAPAQEPAEGRCYLCAEPLNGAGVPLRAGLRDTFTGHPDARVRDSKHLCRACAWSLDDSSAVNGRESGKWRNFSHVVVNGLWKVFTKAVEDRLQLVDILLAPPVVPWCAVIAISGQKHLAYRAPCNAVQLEEQSQTHRPDELRRLLELMNRLLAGGIMKGELATGQWDQRKILRFGPLAFQEITTALEPRRGSKIWELALFLCAAPPKQEETHGSERSTDARTGRDRGGVVDGGPRLVGKAADGNLENLPGADRGVREDDARPRKVHQLNLFGDAS